MLTVTNSAKELLKDTLRRRSEDPEMGLRLSTMSPGQFGVKMDRQMAGDQVVRYQGTKVLIVAPDLVPLMEEAVIDTTNANDGPRLSLYKKASSKPPKSATKDNQERK
jgi:Fe-S cluster assembly iron-binding protein IscA